MSTSSDRVLREQVQALAAARMAYDQASAEVKRANEAFERDHAELLATLEEARTTMVVEERRLRDLTVEAFELTGDVKPAPGVSIRMVTELDYEEATALAWAKEHNMALALDRKGFDAIAKTNPLPFVTVRKVPQATIAKELPVDATAASVTESEVSA